MRLSAITVCAVAILALPWDAAAQMGSQMLRNQTRVVERTVSRNLDRVFKPRLVVRDGATGPVTAMALSADERFLVSAVGDNALRLWDLNAGRELARLPGHDGRVSFIAISPDGARAASASADRTLRLWALRKGGAAEVIGGFAAPLSAVVFLDAQRVVAADQSGTVTLSGGGKVAAHAPGAVALAVLANGGFASGGADGVVRLWDGQGKALASVGVDAPVLGLAASAGRVAAALADGRVVLVDIAAGAVTAALSGHDGPAATVAFGHDGRLYSGGGDGKVLVWRDGKAVMLGRHDGPVTFVSPSRDGAFILSASEDGTTRLWNGATHQPMVTLLSTAEGWAVVDPKGRYDGNQKALDGIDWQGEDAAVGIEAYAETHFEAALLPRVLRQDGLAEAKSIPDGVRYPAKIRFVTPSVSGAAANPTVAVEVEASDDGGSGVAELRLYRNGRQVAADAAQIRRETDSSGAAKLVGRFELALGDGRNVLSATAVNDDRMEGPPQSVVLTAALPPPAPPRVHLLTVGINAYGNKDLNLFYARPDARAVGGFFNGGGHLAEPMGDAVAIEDGQATKDNILKAMAALRQAPAQDLVVIYMAGHGVSLGDEWYFVPHELRDADQPEALRAAGLSSVELKALLESMTADRTLLLLDTCHSGTAVSPLKDYRGLKSLRLLARSVGTHILAATDRNQYAIELARLGHGVFTYALLEGLGGKADTAPADGVVSASEIIRFVEQKVPLLAEQYTEYAQYPTAYSRGVDFPLSRTGKP